MTEFYPFAGEYPTVDEMYECLTARGFGDDVETNVDVPFDGSSGPLVEKLTECRSDDLLKHGSAFFDAVVKQMLGQR